MTKLLSYLARAIEDQVAGPPIFRAKLKAWRNKTFPVFYFLIWFLELEIPLREYSMPFPVRKGARLQCLSC